MDNVKVKLNKDQLDVLFARLNGFIEKNGDTVEEKLLILTIFPVVKKLHTKLFMPSVKNVLSLQHAEAIAFWILFMRYKYANSYEMVTIQPILDQIHKQYRLDQTDKQKTLA
jgi:hypothetical protein